MLITDPDTLEMLYMVDPVCPQCKGTGTVRMTDGYTDALGYWRYISWDEPCDCGAGRAYARSVLYRYDINPDLHN